MKKLLFSVVVTAIALAAVGILAVSGQEADPPCVVAVLNRTAFVQPDGSWIIDNIPSNMGLVRARMTCIRGRNTISGQSDFFEIIPNVITQLDAPIELGVVDPIPESIEVTAPTTTLTTSNLTVQLTVTATYSDGSVSDITLREEGTNYTSSNTNIATVSENGLVTAISSGTVLITASNEQVFASIRLQVVLAADLDGDGIPDDFEIANEMNPNDPVDALEDFDDDGLTNLQEFQEGTAVRDADTDDDTIPDGEEVAAGDDGFVTNPLLADTDGDQIRDALEIETGSNPTDPSSRNFRDALTDIDVTPDSVSLIVNNVFVDETTAQLLVTGFLRDGTTANLTSRTTGTRYMSSDLLVVNFGTTDGKIFAGRDGTAIVTVTNSGFSDTVPVTVSSFTPAPLSRLDLPTNGLANNIDVVEDIAYIAHGAGGLLTVAVGNRQLPSIIGSVDTPGNANDVRVLGNLAYVADGDAGLQVIDVTDPVNPLIVGSVDTPGVAWDVAPTQDGFAYVADGAAGLQVIDVTDPANPTIVGSVDTPGTAKGVAVDGTLAVVADGSSGVHIVDVSDPEAPTIEGSTTVGGDARDVEARNRTAYVAVAASNGFKTVDFTIPTSPVHVGTQNNGGDQLQDVAVAGRFGFGADFLRANGVPIVDVDDPTDVRLLLVMDFNAAFTDADGNGVDADENFVYLVGSKGIIENGTTGTSMLFIGQYLSLQDPYGIPPTVTITSPPDGGTIFERGFAFITAEAEDDVLVASVTFYLDGQPAFTDFGEPFVFPFLVPEGSTQFTVGATAADLAGNTGTAEEITLNVESPAQRIVSVAQKGTPANPGLPSANPGQTIRLESDSTGAFNINTMVTFPTINDSGVTGTTAVKVDSASPDGTLATVIVPTAANTGGVTISGLEANFALQIVPRLDSFNNSDFRPGVNIQLNGAGFIEGDIRVNFGAVQVVDPDTGTGTINVFSTNSALNVAIPASAGGMVSVTTSGGTSNALAVGPGSFTGIVATATFGTPADPGEASANVGQTITVIGTDLKSNTNVIFQTIDDSGTLGTTGVRISGISADKTTATVVVPGQAMTGIVTMLGAPGAFQLQIVPRITSFSNDDFTYSAHSRNLRLDGNGFIEGGTTVDYGTSAVIDPDTSANMMDIFGGGTALNTVIPLRPGPVVQVITEGGTSNPVTVGPMSFTGMQATASVGTPADPDMPSANVGQVITITGTGLKPNTNVRFQARGDGGETGVQSARVSGVNADGTAATVVVPGTAITGSLIVPGTQAEPPEPDSTGLTLVYSNDFESAVGPEWSSQARTTTTGTDVETTTYLGRFSNDTVYLTLSGLPDHSRVVIEWDLFLLDSWDGIGSFGPDFWGYSIVGQPGPELETFFNGGAISPTLLTDRPADVQGEFGPISSWQDRLYRDAAHGSWHSGDTLRIAFYGSNLQGVSDESWGLDNLRVYVDSTPGSVDTVLQVVPRITSFENSEYRHAVNLRLHGSGLVEGDSKVEFGSVSVTDPDMGTGTINVWNNNAVLDVGIPRWGGPTVSVTTSGGTSNSITPGPTSFTGIQGTASFGTPADPDVPSANVGDVITITGTDLKSNTMVFFPSADEDDGVVTGFWSPVSSVSADGTWATVVVPSGAATGELMLGGLEPPVSSPSTEGLSQVFSTDFETGAGAQWSVSNTSTNPVTSTYLGRFANSTATLTLTGLPAHSSIVLEWDLLIIDSWDGAFGGCCSPDLWGFNVAGRPSPEYRYGFPADGSPKSFYRGPDVSRDDFGVLGGWPDRIYQGITHAFNHTDSTLQVSFFGANLEGVNNESWGLDNVRVYVSASSVDEPGSAPEHMLQVVPRLTSFSNTSFAPSGTSRTLQLNGSGLVEAGTTINFGSVAVVDPDGSVNTVDVHSSSQALSTIIPASPGPVVSVTTVGGTSNALTVGPTSFTAIQAIAPSGTPADPGLPSANAGQTITILGTDLKSNTVVIFPTVSDAGAASTQAVNVDSVAVDGAWATVVVPTAATTGSVTISGVSSSFVLQIVPGLTSFSNTSFTPSGTSRSLQLNGSGFVEGGTTINFGPVNVVDPDTSANILDVFSTNTGLNVIIPAGANGLVSIVTAGGTSVEMAVGPTDFTGIQAVAQFGTPADAGQASANVGQVITVTGSTLKANSRLIFPTMDDGGVAGTVAVAPTSLAIDGSWATFVVPQSAVTGTVTVPGTTGSFTLQIVPHITSSNFAPLTAGTTLRLNGSGFIEGRGTTVNFGSVSVIDPDSGTGTVNILNTNTSLDVVVPAGAEQNVTVTTAGGTSVTFNMLVPTIAIESHRNGDPVAEETLITVRARAQDNVSVQSVEFLVNGEAPSAFSGQMNTVTVDGRANIFGAGKSTAPGGGLLPPGIALPAQPGQVVKVLGVSGRVSGWAGGCAYNLADGARVCNSSTNVASSGGISGLIHNSRTMFLTGVFLDDTVPADPAPARLDVSGANSQASIAPQLRQTFFMGDGRTDTGAFQEFVVPAGATRLFLGFVETCSFDTGAGPNCYSDNGGTLTVSLGISDSFPDTFLVAEPIVAGSTVEARLFVTTPAFDPGGDNTLTIEASATDGDGNTTDAAPVVLNVVEPTFSLTATAQSGTPASAGAPSANVGQLITLTSNLKAFSTQTIVSFPTANDSGAQGTTDVLVAGAAADGMTATVSVPGNAVTGVITVENIGSSNFQVVPKLTSFDGNSDFVTGQFIRFYGSGFVEGGTTVMFGAVPVVDPNTSTGTIDIWQSNTALNLNSGIPANAGSTITVVTAGGTSAPFVMGPTSFTAIQALASSGTPADAGQPSANVGQVITLTGSDFRSNTNVAFNTINENNGTSGTVYARISGLSADRTVATVVVPGTTVTGQVMLFGTPQALPLQVVPRVTGFESNSDFRPGEFLRLTGSGFVEGGSTVKFGDVTVTDPDSGSNIINVWNSHTRLDLNIPADAGSTITVVTAGGTSAPFVMGPTSFTAIQALASSGTPADAGQPSANVGQVITLTGSDFRSNTNVAFNTINENNGTSGVVYARISGLSADRAMATVVVPSTAITGQVMLFGTPQALPLQVVPRVTGFESNSDFRPGEFLRLVGSGFVEGNSTVRFGGVAVTDPDVGTSVINVWNSHTRLDLNIPADAGSIITVVTAGGTSAPFVMGPTSFTAIQALASSGTPADAGQPSANVGQVITLTGSDFRSNTNVYFPTMSDGGVPGSTPVRVISLAADRSWATVAVPSGAVTGDVSVFGTTGAFRLQIVPRLTGFSNSAFLPSGTSRNMQLFGSAFIEGDTTVNYGDTPVVDPDAGFETLDVFSTGTSLNVVIPDNPGPIITVVTSGGTSAPLTVGPTSFTAIQATASSGTPADAGQPSANTGQLITVLGSDFRSNTYLTFPVLDGSGVPGFQSVQVNSVNADGTSALFVVPNEAVTGNVSMTGTGVALPLQIVPHVSSFSMSSFTPGTNLRLNGGGFMEGATTVNFGPVAVVDPDTSWPTIDVFSNNTAMNVTIPSGGDPTVTVVTVGGTSNTVALLEDTIGAASTPDVAITSPVVADTVFRKGALLITASATDDVFLKSVTFTLKDQALEEILSFTDSQAPYEFLYFVPDDSPAQLVVGATAEDLAGNVGEAQEIIVNVADSDASIAATATVGTPADPGLPSANVGQAITLNGVAGAFTSITTVTFPTSADNGTKGTAQVTVNSVATDGSSATVVVPASAATGGLVISGVVGNFALQVVPTITTFSNSDFLPGANLRLDGSGFIEGGVTVNFGSIAVVDPNTGNSTVDVFFTNNSMNVTIPANPGSEVSVTTAGGTSNTVTVGPESFTGLEGVAAFGTPANSGLPSANAGQAVTVRGTGLKANTNVTFTTKDDNGVTGTRSVRVSSAAADGTSASVIVPTDAVTGSVTMPGVPGSFTLQVVPRITSFSNSDFTPSGNSRSLQLTGGGFVEGGTTVTFGPVSVVDPDISFNILDVFWTNTGLNVVIPPGALSQVTVTTAGGTSNVLTVGPGSFMGLDAEAAMGTPANPAQPSANAGQAITVLGTELKANTNLVFPTRDDSGLPGSMSVRVSSLSADGTSATVVVPLAAVTGNVTMSGAVGSFALQVVPRLNSFVNDDFRPGVNLRLDGTGFMEGGTTVNLGAVQVVDPNIGSGTVDVFWTNTGLNVVIPSGASGMVSVTTAGGTSNTLSVGPSTFTGIQAVANTGTPANPALPSANAGQLILVSGTDLKPNTNLLFPAVGDDGSAYTQPARVSSVASDGTWATVVVPQAAATGDVTMPGTTGSFRLQVVPRLNSFVNDDFRPGVNLRLEGSGFVEGGTTVNFGAVSVVDPSISADTLDVFWTNTAFNVVIPSGASGMVSVTTAGGTSNTLSVGPSTFTGIQAVANTGTPANPALPSANAGQLILVSGTDLKPNTNLLFPAVGDDGSAYTQPARVSSVASDGTWATVVVPQAAATGDVTMPGTTGSFRLQVVPVMTSFSNDDFRPSGGSRNLHVNGSGFMEGGTTVNFGAVSVVDPSISADTLDVFWTNTAFNVVIPSGAGGMVSVTTAGGTSNTLSVGPSTFTGIQAVANTGTPANPALPSANAGQLILVSGTDLKPNTNVVFLAVDDAGNQYDQYVRVSGVDPEGTEAWVVVPHGARRGAVRLFGTATSFEFQVVPTITSFSYSSFTQGANLRLTGSGYVEGDTTVNFGSTAVVDPDASSSLLDVFWDGTNLNVTIPFGAGQDVRVTTDGGTSQTVHMTQPTVFIASPLNGALAAAESVINITAVAMDNTGIQSVEFLVDGVVAFTDTTAPYQFAFTTPAFDAGGDNSVTLGARATDLDSNVATATDIAITIVAPTFAIDAVASSGTPADAGQPSANVGQSIVLEASYPAFTSSTQVTFSIMNDAGPANTRNVQVSSVFDGGLRATVVVPGDAVTGTLSVSGVGSGTLQIVPRVTGFEVNSDFRTGEFLRLVGSGFIEGDSTVHFGSVAVVDPDTGSNVINIWNTNTRLDLNIPDGAGSSVTVETSGGTSAALVLGPTAFSGIQAVADSGTPADPGIPSANPGQMVTVTGTGLRSTTNVTFQITNDSGGAGRQSVRVSSVNLDGTEATVVVPTAAVTGLVTLQGVPLDNLLQNGGNEQALVGGEIPGWTEVTGTEWTRRTSNPAPFDGGAYFFAGAGASAELRQDVDVSAFADSIAAGTQSFVFEGFARSYNQTPTDTARIIVEYRDATNSVVLDSFDSGEIASRTAWVRVADTRVAPGGTRFIRVRLISTRFAGDNNDGYFDALSLRPLSGTEPAFQLQIVPRVTGFEFNNDFRPGEFMRLVGSGFIEGDVAVRFGSVEVIDPDEGGSTINVWNGNTRLDLNIPSGAGSAVTVVTDGGTSAPFFAGPMSFTGIQATAQFGTPADPDVPSANVGQIITLTGTGITYNTNVVFTSVNEGSGALGVVYARVAGVNIDGTAATVVVPNGANTGPVFLFGAPESFQLQVVPRVTGFESNSDFAPGNFLRLVGSGFVEGDVVVNFGSVAVTDPDAGTNVINVWNTSTRLDLFIPTGAGSPITVVTDGGTSEPFHMAPTAFTAIEVLASAGTPADPGLPSANVGQVITLIGGGFRANTNITFPTVNDSGVASVAFVRVSGINADGTEATVVVPNGAVTGRLSVPGIADTPTLQVVPHIGSFSRTASGSSTILRLNGGGYVEGATTVNIGGAAVADPGTDTATLDVFSSGTSLNVVMPNAGGEVNVVTAGGTSNSITVGVNVPAGQQDLSLLPGTTATASTVFNSSYMPPNAIDGVLASGWFSANNDPAPSFTVTFNQDVTVHSLQIVPDSRWPTGFNFLSGQFTLYDAADVELYSTGAVSSTAGNFNVPVTPAITGVRKVVFAGISWESVEPGFGEFAVVGTAP